MSRFWCINMPESSLLFLSTVLYVLFYIGVSQFTNHARVYARMVRKSPYPILCVPMWPLLARLVLTLCRHIDCANIHPYVTSHVAFARATARQTLTRLDSWMPVDVGVVLVDELLERPVDAHRLETTKLFDAGGLFAHARQRPVEASVMVVDELLERPVDARWLDTTQRLEAEGLCTHATDVRGPSNLHCIQFPVENLEHLPTRPMSFKSLSMVSSRVSTFKWCGPCGPPASLQSRVGVGCSRMGFGGALARLRHDTYGLVKAHLIITSNQNKRLV